MEKNKPFPFAQSELVKNQKNNVNDPSYKHPVGILGGTFDPIHLGHLYIAKHLLEDLKLQIINFIPSFQTPDRTSTMVSAEHRLAMIRIAIEPYLDFWLNDMEIVRGGISYSYDTLTALRESIPTQPLCLILGEDVFALFNQWKNWQKIPDLTHLVVASRPGSSIPEEKWIKDLLKDRQTHDPKKLGMSPGGHIYLHQFISSAINATDIREKIATGEDTSAELPPGVLKYIKQHHLYEATKNNRSKDKG